MAGEIIVTWSDSYSVGIKVIDDQHIKLVGLTNKLFSSCVAGGEKAKIDSVFMDVVNEVVDYVGYHFSTEEKIMERIAYPDYKQHKQEHINFVKEVLAKVEEFKFGKINTAISFVFYLRDWILQHIAVNDKKLGTYILDLKSNGAFEQIVVKDKEEKSLEVL